MMSLKSAKTANIDVGIPNTPDFLQDVDRTGSADWRFYATGVVLCLVNLMAAWDATTLSIALPVGASPVRINLLGVELTSVRTDDSEDTTGFNIQHLLAGARFSRRSDEFLAVIRYALRGLWQKGNAPYGTARLRRGIVRRCCLQ